MILARKLALLYLCGFAFALAIQAVIVGHGESGREALGLFAALVLAALPCVLLLTRYLRGELVRHAVAEALVVTEATRRMAELEAAHLADRIVTVGKIAAMAHELGTPLAVVQAHAQMMATGEVDETDLSRTAAVMLQQTQRMTQMVQEVLTVARAKTGSRSVVDLAVVARQTISLLAPLAQLHHMTVRLVGEESNATVEGEPSKLLQILTNLTMNAQQSMIDGGTVTLSVGTRMATPPAGLGSAGARRFVAVQDAGSGIHKEDMPRLFKSFFTTKKNGKGTGLGLAVSYRIASDHGGWIDVESKPGMGSCFTLYLPFAGA